MNEHISIRRIGMLFKHDWTTYWKDKAWLCALLFTCLLFAYLLAERMNAFAVMFGVFAGVMIALAPLVFASRVFANMRTKQQRIAFFMLPATRTEKYIVRFVDYAIVPTVLVVLVMLFTALLIVILSGPEDIYEILNKILTRPLFSEEINSTIVKGLLALFFSWSSMISLMVLGGTVFGRYAIVKTFVVVFAIQILFASTLSVNLTPVFVSALESGDEVKVVGDWLGMAALIDMTETIVFLAVSYFLFRRKQII